MYLAEVILPVLLDQRVDLQAENSVDHSQLEADLGQRVLINCFKPNSFFGLKKKKK